MLNRKIIALTLFIAGCGGNGLSIVSQVDAGARDSFIPERCDVDLDVPIRVFGSSATCSVTRIGDEMTLRTRVISGGEVLDLEIDAVQNAISALPGPGRSGWYSTSSGLYCGDVNGIVRQYTTPLGDRFIVKTGCQDQNIGLVGEIDYFK